jgi:hypothetical protein
VPATPTGGSRSARGDDATDQPADPFGAILALLAAGQVFARQQRGSEAGSLGPLEPGRIRAVRDDDLDAGRQVASSNRLRYGSQVGAAPGDKDSELQLRAWGEG